MELNAYQIYILNELNKLPLMYINIFHWKQAWLSNHIFETEANLNNWEKQLIDEGYVLKEKPVMFTLVPETNSLRVKIEQKGRDYLALLLIVEMNSNPFEIKTQKEIQDQKFIFEILSCLNCKWNGSEIMKNEEYERLVQYTNLIIKNGNLPPNIIPISQTNISNAFLRVTFHKLYKKFNKKASREIWIDFIHEVFEQFNDVEKNSTNSHFKDYSKNSNYERDKESIDCKK